jgi:hypothetical protein
MLNIIAGVFSDPTAAATNSYESIATTTVGSGGAANIEFTSIPSTYQHLQIRCMISGVHSSTTHHDISVQLNSDTAGNYSFHRLRGNGSDAAGQASTNSTSMAALFLSVSASATSIFGASVIDILDYKDTNKYTTMRSFGGCDLNGSGAVGISSGSWRNTNAITSIKLFNSLGNLYQYSTATLYGIKG